MRPNLRIDTGGSAWGKNDRICPACGVDVGEMSGLNCDRCDMAFCVERRSPGNHECAAKGAQHEERGGHGKTIMVAVSIIAVILPGLPNSTPGSLRPRRVRGRPATLGEQEGHHVFSPENPYR